MYPCLLPKKPIAALIASLGLMTALPAGATVIDGLSAQATAKAGTNTPVNVGPNTSTTSTSAYASDTDMQSNTSASSFGYAVGPYRASADGSGEFDSTGHFIRQWDVTNDSGVAQNYSFDFFIYYGSLTASDNGAGGSGFAEYMVNITQDGSTSLFSSAAKIASDGTLTTSGTALDGASQSGSTYSWGGTHFNVNLGVLAPGASTSVVYDLIGHAFGNYDFVTGVDCGYGGYGDVGPLFTDGTIGNCTGSSYASLGDPDSLNNTPIPGIGITASPVPEPGTLALLGVGFAALRFRRRHHPG